MESMVARIAVPLLQCVNDRLWPISTVTGIRPERLLSGDKLPPVRHAPDGQGIAVQRFGRTSR
jgi:hypothetical protein